MKYKTMPTLYNKDVLHCFHFPAKREETSSWADETEEKSSCDASPETQEKNTYSGSDWLH